MDFSEPVIFIIVRTDLDMKLNKIVVHCAQTTERLLWETPIQEIQQYQSYGSSKVVFQIDSEEKLDRLEREARESGILTYIMRDSGQMSLPAGTKTVLGVGPVLRRDVPINILALKLL